jgi:hypothetical protein
MGVVAEDALYLADTQVLGWLLHQINDLLPKRTRLIGILGVGERPPARQPVSSACRTAAWR